MTSQQRHVFTIMCITATMLSGFTISCSSARQAPRIQNPVPLKEQSQPSTRIFSAGWSNIAKQSNDPSVLIWLLNNDRSATIVLREFLSDAQTALPLGQEDVCVIGQLSMRMKLEQYPDRYRITRMPEHISNGEDICSYVFEERGLLRRVMTFRKAGRTYETEILQERTSENFESLTVELLHFIEWFSLQ